MSVIDTIYKWPAGEDADQGLYALAELTGSEHACILDIDLSSGSISECAVYGKSFSAANSVTNLILEHCGSWDQNNVCDLASLTISPAAHAIAGVILRQPERCVLLCFYRRRNKATFGQSEKRHLQLCLPHWRRSLQLTENINMTAEDAVMLEKILNQAPFGIVLVDEDLKVRYRNVWARDMAASNDGISLNGGYLKLSKRNSQKLFIEMLHKWSAADRESQISNVNVIKVERKSGAKPYSLLLMPVNPEEFSLTNKSKIYGIFIDDELYRMPVDVEVLKKMQGLTESEARMCEILYKTHSLNKTAEQLQVSSSTIKTHLLNTFRKMDINSQAELMRYLAHMPKFYSNKLQ